MFLDMVNPISSSIANQISQGPNPAVRQQQPEKPKAAQEDTVTLKSTGDVDHDGDSK